MLSPDKIDAIVSAAASKNFGPKSFIRTFNEPSVTFHGEEAIQITIMISERAATRPDGEAAVNTLVEIFQTLQKAGDDRFPIVGYATEKELVDADSED